MDSGALIFAQDVDTGNIRVYPANKCFHCKHLFPVPASPVLEDTEPDQNNP
jgi:hypothetical protein